MEYAQNLLSTRRGTLIVGALAAGVALVMLLVYLGQYRSSLSVGAASTPVLVAKTLIPQGTPGDVVGSSERFEVASISAGHVKAGALADPSALTGRVAASDIYPGQQITAADFAAAPSNPLVTKLVGGERAVSIPVAGGAGLVSSIGPGDRVDLFVGLNVDRGGVTSPVIKLLSENVLVLQAAGEGGEIVVRSRGAEAARLALAADHGKLWVVLRPATGAQSTKSNVISVENLLALKPVTGGRP